MRDKPRIAIVGAGAAGLAAAYELKKRGYPNITIFEKRRRVGGKCLTQVIEGRRYEIGALIVGIAYDNILELLREVDLETAPLDAIQIIDIEKPELGATLTPAERGRMLLDLARLAADCLRCQRKLSRQGFCGWEFTDRACCTFDEWLHRSRLTAARSLVAPYYVGWGYGYLEQVAAVYVFKLLAFYLRSLKKMVSSPYRRQSMWSIPMGYQMLWEKIAAGFDLRLGSCIRSIRRNCEKVTVRTVDGAHSFDSLILACPLNGALQFLDATAEERLLFGKIKTLDFVTLTGEADGLPSGHLVFVSNHHTPLKPGRIVSWYRRWKDRNICVFYTIGDHFLSDRQLIANAASDIAKLGGRLDQIHRIDHWDYFPHVPPADIAAGYFRDLETLQGRNKTWYVGELLSFPTVEHVVAYSRHLVRSHF